MNRTNFQKNLTIKNCAFIFPLMILLFQSFCLEKLVKMSNRSIYNYRCPRFSEGFNISLVKDKEGLVNVYDKYRKIFEFNFDDLKGNDENSVKALLFDAFSTKKAFNIRIHGKYLLIYNSRSIADEVYTLENEDIATFGELISSTLVKNPPVSKGMLDTFIYLFCKGYFDDYMIILYRRSIMLYSADGNFTHFDADFRPLLDVDLTEGRNSFLAFIRVFKSYLGYVTNRTKNEKYVSILPFLDKMKLFLSCGKDKEVAELVRNYKFREIEGMIDQKEIDEIFSIAERMEVRKQFKELLILD